MKRKMAIAAGCIVVVMAMMVLLWRLPLEPAKPWVDPATLLPVCVPVSPESNAFPGLLLAHSLMATPDLRCFNLGSTNWDATKAREIVVTNQAALDAMRAALSLPGLQFEAVTNYAQVFPYLTDCRDIAQLGLMKARLSFDDGKESSGFEQAMQIIDFGRRLQSANGVYIHGLVGFAVQSDGGRFVRQFAERTGLPATNLVSLSSRLVSWEADPATMREQLKREYLVSSSLFEDFSKRPEVMTRFVFNERKSKQELADQILCTMRALTNTYAMGQKFIPVMDTNRTWMRRMLTGNYLGGVLNDMSLDFRYGLLRLKCRQNVEIRATRTILALRAFQMVNHRSAASLQELVPKFLDAVPLDDFDGKPLRYNPAEKKIYSVGVDLIDSGGVPGTNSTSGDIVYHYDF